MKSPSKGKLICFFCQGNGSYFYLKHKDKVLRLCKDCSEWVKIMLEDA